MYTRAGILEHLPDLEPVLNKERFCPLIAVILPSLEFQYKQEYLVLKLHKTECLSRVSISYDAHQRKQIAFCPYCGVMNENTLIAHIHVRKHLGMVFLCGGCYGKVYK